MNYRFLSVILITGLISFVVIGFSVFNDKVESKSVTGPVLSKEEAISRAMNRFGPNANAKVIDVRLLRHKEALNAMGAWVNYDRPDFKYTKDTPVWVVSVSADSLQDLPMVADDSAPHKGAIFVFSATDGGPVMDSYMVDVNTDKDLKHLKALPDQQGTMAINPAAPTTAAAMEPTATPAVSTQ
ncbi:MAG: hypothetical protein U0350_05465 [Caldilineaceae bacterium]